MKVTPISGPNMGSANLDSGTSVAPSRKEAAKQAFLGNTGTTVTKEEQAPQALVDALNVKRIKMRTNASPDREERLEENLNPESAIQNTGETEEPEVTRPISPQFAALAKQRRALQVKEQEIALREKALAEKGSQDGALDFEKLRTNPLGILQEAGVTYEQLTEAILAEQSGQDPRIAAMQAEIEALKTGLDTKFTERDAQAEKQVLTEIEREAKLLVAEGDDFEMVRGTNSVPKVIELIKRTWQTSGEVLDVQEAAKLVEDQLVEDSLKMANFGKVRSRLTPAEQVQANAQNRNQGLKTLTNRDTAVRPSSARARAMAAFNGTLKR